MTNSAINESVIKGARSVDPSSFNRRSSRPYCSPTARQGSVDINPATGLRYIKLDSFIYTIEDIVYPLLSSNFSTLVSLNLLPTNSKITKLILQNQSISKDENNFWQSNISITADNINTIIDNWLHRQAFGVHKYFEREPSQATGHDEVFIYLKSHEQEIRYLVTDTDPWLILARPEIDIEYHLDIKAYDELIAPQ
jgi:hypothetical protein